MKCALWLGALLGCTPLPRAEWSDAPRSPAALQAELAALSAARPDRPYGFNLALTIAHRDLGARMRARGAAAIRPPDALRMIMVGPAGTTAFDLWLCGDRFRMAIPAVSLERRGDARTPAAELRGMPVGFLRWWFLRPYSGRLLYAADRAGERRYLLRDDEGALVDIVRSGERVSVRRAFRGDVETIDARVGPCDEVSYRQRSTGVAIEVRCEELSPRPPPARAFDDPDDPSRPCGGG